jgi:ElaB/YqjD/DUF883 family membrane-anchored ribosome-binding protein
MAQIRARIERTRDDMSATIDAIQEKLSPGQIAEQVRHTVHEQIEGAKASVREATIGKAESLMRDAGGTMREVQYSTADTIRNNPIPAAMVAIGLGWLLMNRSSGRRERFEEYTRRRSDQYRYGDDQYRYGGEIYYNPNHPAYRGDAMAIQGSGQRHDEGLLAQGQRRAGEVAEQAQSAVGDAVSQAQNAVGGAVNQAQSAVSDVAQRAQSAVGSTVNRAQESAGALMGRTAYTAERVEDQFQRLLWENPLAVGAVALAVGAAAGFALPQTERENQLMGEARDTLVEQAQSAAQEAMGKAQQVASEVARTAEQTAADKSREVGLAGNN